MTRPEVAAIINVAAVLGGVVVGSLIAWWLGVRRPEWLAAGRAARELPRVRAERLRSEAFRVVDHACRAAAPRRLQDAGRPDLATTLRQLPPLVDRVSVDRALVATWLEGLNYHAENPSTRMVARVMDATNHSVMFLWHSTSAPDAEGVATNSALALCWAARTHPDRAVDEPVTAEELAAVGAAFASVASAVR